VNTVPRFVMNKLYPVGECTIWVGLYVNNAPGHTRRLCYVKTRDGEINVREVLFGAATDFNYATPACGHGRCLAAEHQVKTPKPTKGEAA
jgi:hypothetical protein